MEVKPLVVLQPAQAAQTAVTGAKVDHAADVSEVYATTRKPGP
ncbi:hypothetical protein OV079_19930 [Nannocystis pusilla]|uniref:Uncharacterized protein n=1 Tax=Nannocystis pusilla TaxID=889268 RepID=A0A9X3IXS6_9BACT|nr:hypothetical protein [Nannocystis pusilla]MCY1007781.1 hypothetical protein [Nannocystis pusilla]